MQPSRELVVSVLRVLIGANVGPLFESSADEAFSLAIGAWSIRPGKEVFDADGARTL
jgi:hypothetical protein